MTARRTAADFSATRALLGGLAGAFGVWAMDRVGWFLFDREDAADKELELRARVGGKDVAHAAVDKACVILGKEPMEQPNPYGIALHYALGVLPGAAYALLRSKYSWLKLGNGALYGFGLFLVMDEVVAPLAGVASPPGRYPAVAHLRGLASHVVLGVGTESLLKLVGRPR